MIVPREVWRDGRLRLARACVNEQGVNNGGRIVFDRSRVRILVCDPSTSLDVVDLLRGCSYQVIAVQNALQVMEVCRTGMAHIELILAEVELPKKRGFKMLKCFMKEEQLKQIPIVMMSSRDEMAVVGKCLRLGAADYLVKPLRTNELLNLWTHMWRRRRMLGLTEKHLISGSLNATDSPLDLLFPDTSNSNTTSTDIFSEDGNDQARRNVMDGANSRLASSNFEARRCVMNGANSRLASSNEEARRNAMDTANIMPASTDEEACHGVKDGANIKLVGTDTQKKKKKKKRMEESEYDDDNNDMRSSWPFASRYTSTTLLLAGFAFFLRVLVGLHSYSGKGTPPKFGDYEAQRHWMEITIHTPVVDWYRNTTDNDLGWWGLDYPPLTAFQSYVHGLVIHALDPEAVSLHSSRGYETSGSLLVEYFTFIFLRILSEKTRKTLGFVRECSKLLLRWTVLSSDILVFFPAALCFINVCYGHRGAKQRIWALAMILLQPALIIIDHGHFQYNCISLGLAVGAAAAVVSRQELLGCVLFSLSLNHKQMSMYYAPAFFAYLLGKSLQRRNPLLRVFLLGCTVILSFTICWWPFLRSSGGALEVLSRLAPLHRGIYEDYVANFWCGTAMLFKWKHLFAQPTLAKLALGATIAAVLPSMVQQIWAPSRKGFLYAMLNSSFAFYFFSYQVHEKSVLLPVIPASLLALEEPQLLQWLVPYSMFSMLPLLCRDDLLVPYLALSWLFLLIPRPPTQSQNKSGASHRPDLKRIFLCVSVLGAVVLHLMYFRLQPPKRYPFLFEAFIMSLLVCPLCSSGSLYKLEAVDNSC